MTADSKNSHHQHYNHSRGGGGALFHSPSLGSIFIPVPSTTDFNSEKKRAHSGQGGGASIIEKFGSITGLNTGNTVGKGTGVFTLTINSA